MTADEIEVAIGRWNAELVDLIEQSRNSRKTYICGKLCRNHPYRIRLERRKMAIRWIIKLLGPSAGKERK